METIDDAPQRQQLEQANRILRKQLQRSEADRRQLEETNEKKEHLLRQVIDEFKESQATLEKKTQALEQVLHKLQQAQTQLVHSEKMSGLGQLVAGVAHEINNPVNFISGNVTYVSEYTQDLLDLLQLYQKYYPVPVPPIQAKAEAIELDFLLEDLPRLIASVKAGANRIQKIVVSLRNFSRLDEAEMKVVDIHEGIDSTLMLLQTRLMAKPGQTEIQISKNYGVLPLVQCYAGQLNQVLMNVLANAIDALEVQRSEPQPESPAAIQIQTQCLNDQWVNLRITDNGPGIPKEMQPRLFDPFFTTKPVGQGVGLGLSISYQIVVEKHGGTLQCFSAPGQGTAFVIEIPVQQQTID
ncbi:MAG TPA: ATP-binding protein [Crinalium sp.]